ncbi:MAG: sigma 54-interacting transcriptional regulator [Magnetococcales bacterium]|nr:sigma 54-interacting transcriptional regulator [Magnetococcales bacterium]
MGGNILVVDDEPSILVVIASFLTKAGYMVETVSSFEDAIHTLDNAQPQIDLVISDIHLGDKDGLDLLREIQNRRYNTLVLLITGFPKLETVQEALRLGAHDYMEKPVLKETLLQRTHAAMRHKKLQDERQRYRHHLAAILNSVQDAILTIAPDGRVREFNAAAIKLFKISKANAGQPLTKALPHCGPQLNELLEPVFKSSSQAHNVQIICPQEGPSQRVFSVSASPLHGATSKGSDAVLVIRDETRLAALERDLNARRAFHNMVGKSPEMRKIYTLIEQLGHMDTTVLITGESGTGKELVAEAIHFQSRRHDAPLVKLNCAALPENLLESELFGHVRGAFTGAIRDKIGRFQQADTGTIFLDEIGDITPRMQTQLLRILQEKAFERVGDVDTIHVDVRVVAATNRNLRKGVAEQRFREDLFYRLKVVEIRIPSLRERREDIPLLMDHFLGRFSERFSKRIHGYTKEVLKRFMNYPWPGNIRELEHVIEHAFVVCQSSVINLEDLPPELRTPSTPPLPTPPTDETAPATPPPLFLHEKERIRQALDSTGWNKVKTARKLGIGRSTLYRKMRQYDLDSVPESV